MTIVYLCHRVPFPPDKGERIRSYHHVAHLARRHRVHLACLAASRADLENARSLERLCASVDLVHRSPAAERMIALSALATGRPLSIAAFDSRELRSRLTRRIREERPDVLFAQTAAMAQYIDDGADTPRVVDFVDADSEKWRWYGRLRPFPYSAIYALEADRLARYEGRIASRFDASIFVSEAEAEIVRPHASSRAMTVISNGVDLDRFRPKPGDATAEPRMVFVGDMGYFPNVDAMVHFTRDVWPRVRGEMPGARLAIVGRNPAAAVRRMSRLPGVTVTGTVESVHPFLSEAALAVAPFRISRGVPNKILEAMASGLPVVGTPLAFQALAATGEDGIRVADTPEVFAREVVALLRDPALRANLGHRARRFVERNHRWERSGDLLESTIADAIEARGGARARRADAP